MKRELVEKKFYEVKRVKGKNNGEKGTLKRRVRKWMREETSEAMIRLFCIIGNSTVS